MQSLRPWGKYHLHTKTVDEYHSLTWFLQYTINSTFGSTFHLKKNNLSTFQTIVMDAILFVISFFFLNFFLYQNILKCKNFHITTKYLILPLQNFADFHIKIKMINFEASFNVKFSFEYFNNFHWLRQAVISTLIRSHFPS